MKKVESLFFLLLTFTFWSCSHYSTTSTALPARIKTVAVSLAENQTLEPDIETELTDSIADRFLADGTLKLVEQQEADVVIHAQITDIKEEAFTYTSGKTGEKAQEYRVIVLTKVYCLDTEKDKRLWERDSLKGWGIYKPEDSQSRAKALGEAFQMIASEIVKKTVAGW